MAVTATSTVNDVYKRQKENSLKRILSILLVLAMLLSMIPAVFAANCDITVSTPAPDPVKVGALYQLPLGTVFTDPNGHALSFALTADYGDTVYIQDKLQDQLAVQPDAEN